MKRIKKIILLVAISSIFIIMSIIHIMALPSNTVADDYDTTEKIWLQEIKSNYAKDCTLSINTRPIVGQNGVIVTCQKPNGEVIDKRLFPYYVSISSLKITLKSGETVRVYVEPAASGRRVKGVLYTTKEE